MAAGETPTPGGTPTAPAPRPLRPGFARPARGLHLRFSLFATERDEKTKTRENNKTLQCEVNGAVRSVGRVGQGRSKRVRRDWRRGQDAGRPLLGGSCTPGAAAGWGSGRSCEAGRRRRGPRAGPGGAEPLRVPPRFPRGQPPRPGAGLPLLATRLWPPPQPRRPGTPGSLSGAPEWRRSPF